MEAQAIIHVRFSPDGAVTEISDRPAAATAQAWFNRLSQCAAKNYQTFAGGRAVYRLSQADLDALKSSYAPQGSV